MSVSLTREQEEELECVEDISDSDTVVGRILEDDEDGKTKENWQKLVRKLSNKRKKKEGAGKSKTSAEAEREEKREEEREEDNIPEDWRPDFIPRDWEVVAAQQQPDLVQTTQQPLQQPASALVKFRSEHRRYLQREMGRMKRNSLAAEIVPEEEEEEEGEERFTVAQPQQYIRPRFTM